jgi:hypothetical protein
MKGTIKTISTGKDIMNCLELVQSGELVAGDLAAHIAAIEERGFMRVPILELSKDGKTAVIRECAEIVAGAKVKGVAGCAVAAIDKIAGAENAEDGADGMNEDVRLSVKLSKPLTQDAAALCFTSPVDPLEELGITPEAVAAIKEVLKNYE